MVASFPEPPEIEVIVVAVPTGIPIGAMCLSSLDEWNGKAEFSVGFCKATGTRAVWESIHAAFAFIFDSLHVRKLIFYALQGNRQAISLLDRIGARPEGVLVSELVLADSSTASLLRYALFRERDWAGLSAHLARIAPLVSPKTGS